MLLYIGIWFYLHKGEENLIDVTLFTLTRLNKISMKWFLMVEISWLRFTFESVERFLSTFRKSSSNWEFIRAKVQRAQTLKHNSLVIFGYFFHSNGRSSCSMEALNMYTIKPPSSSTLMVLSFSVQAISLAWPSRNNLFSSGGILKHRCIVEYNK